MFIDFCGCERMISRIKIMCKIFFWRIFSKEVEFWL